MSTSLNQQNKLVTNRVTVAPPATVSPKWARRRPISHLSMAGCGAQTFRNIHAAPKSGWCMVRPYFHTDYAGGTSTVTAWAVAGGRAFLDNNPLNTDGTPATWRVGAAVNLPAASATQGTDGLYGVAVGNWTAAFVPPAIDRPGPGYLTFSAQPAATNARCIVSNNVTEYTSSSGLELTGMEHRAVIAGAGTDFTTVNQGAFVSSGQSFGPDYNFIVAYDWLPLEGTVESLVMFTDSMAEGFSTGLNNTAVSSYGFSYSSYATWLLRQQGRLVSYASYGSTGQDYPFFHGRLAQAELDPEFVPTWTGIAGFSVNGLLTATNIDNGLTSAFTRYDASEARGSKPFLITVNAPAAQTAEQLANRIRGNAKIRASGRRYFDFAALMQDPNRAPLPRLAAAYTYDDTHLQKVGHRFAGTALADFLRTL